MESVEVKMETEEPSPDKMAERSVNGFLKLHPDESFEVEYDEVAAWTSYCRSISSTPEPPEASFVKVKTEPDDQASQCATEHPDISFNMDEDEAVIKQEDISLKECLIPLRRCDNKAVVSATPRHPERNNLSVEKEYDSDRSVNEGERIDDTVGVQGTPSEFAVATGDGGKQETQQSVAPRPSYPDWIPYKCTRCWEEFLNEYALTKHLQRHQEQDEESDSSDDSEDDEDLGEVGGRGKDPEMNNPAEEVAAP